MPGKIEEARNSHLDPGLPARGHPWEVRYLPIFRDPLFAAADHNVKNWTWYPDSGFCGEDSMGWGLHQNGIVDCVSLPDVPGADARQLQSWTELVELMGLADTYRKVQASGDLSQIHKMNTELIRQVVIQVRLCEPDIKWVPDPTLYSMVVSRESSTGRLELKSGLAGGLEGKRRSFFQLRSPFPDFSESRP